MRHCGSPPSCKESGPRQSVASARETISLGRDDEKVNGLQIRGHRGIFQGKKYYSAL